MKVAYVRVHDSVTGRLKFAGVTRYAHPRMWEVVELESAVFPVDLLHMGKTMGADGCIVDGCMDSGEALPSDFGVPTVYLDIGNSRRNRRINEIVHDNAQTIRLALAELLQSSVGIVRYGIILQVKKTASRVLPEMLCCLLSIFIRTAAAESQATFLSRETVLGFKPGKDVYFNANADMWPTNGVTGVGQRKNCTWIFYRTFPGLPAWRGVKSFVLETEDPPAAGGKVKLQLDRKGKAGRLDLVSDWTRTMRFETGLGPSDEVSFNALVFTLPKGQEKHSYRLVRMDAERMVTAAACCSLSVETGLRFHATRGSDEPVALVFANTGDRRLGFHGTVSLKGPGNCEIRRKVAFDLAPSGTFRETVGDVPAFGPWKVEARLASEGSQTVLRSSFAKIRRNERTAPLPDGKFRIGLNYHMRRYSPIDREITLEALVASGAKLVRGVSATFASVSPSEGVYSWQGTDEILNQLWERGLAVNLNIWDTPRWAADETHRTNANWLVWIRSLPRPGLYEDYARRLVGRYGTKVAYYELGNEWDLEPADRLTIEDGIAAQRLAYRTIKAACSAAVVSPNGWACWSSDDAKVRQRGFQERLMTEARGCYDVHPVHLHGPFGDYRKEATKFLALRRKLGITVPWYANETAESTMFGNDERVADCVWKKVLWSWAKGSRDFIWYNLRATGYDLGDWEQGYGLLTADYHPRPSYAAFAALTHVFNGLDFERSLADDHDRGLFVFRRPGPSPAVIVAGWDEIEATTLEVAADAKTARTCDLFGNERSVEVLDGKPIRWKPSSRPGCLILEGATRCETARPAARPAPQPPMLVLSDRPWSSRAPDLVLDRPWQVTDLYKADPVREHRLWKGPEDLSARAWFTRGEDGLRVRVEVTDDFRVTPKGGENGDFVKVIAGRPEKPVRVPLWEGLAKYGLEVVRSGKTTVYSATIPFEALGLPADWREGGLYVDLHLIENDGEGFDGWMSAR